jgi:hypothetical protein
MIKRAVAAAHAPAQQPAHFVAHAPPHASLALPKLDADDARTRRLLRNFHLNQYTDRSCPTTAIVHAIMPHRAVASELQTHKNH